MRTVRRMASKRSAIRAALFFGAMLLASVPAPAAPRSLDEIAALSARQRENVLAGIRNSEDGEIYLLTLETAAGLRADERRESGRPPLFPGCLRADEFELAVQFALARAAYDSRAYRALAREYRRLSTAFERALAEAQAGGEWRRRFAHLDRWIEDWERARDPVTRELFRRTLTDQAIRVSLSSYQGSKLYGESRPTPALRAYDEFLFNLMCTADEDNLTWLKQQVARAGWFDIGRFGRAADHAAWLMVQHADGDPAYQATIAGMLESRLATRDTSAQNFALLSDHIAVRAGRPQKFATQMECVEGEWVAPRIEAPESLEARRTALGLEPYDAQLARRKHLCGAGETRVAGQ